MKAGRHASSDLTGTPRKFRPAVKLGEQPHWLTAVSTVELPKYKVQLRLHVSGG